MFALLRFKSRYVRRISVGEDYLGAQQESRRPITTQLLYHSSCEGNPGHWACGQELVDTHSDRAKRIYSTLDSWAYTQSSGVSQSLDRLAVVWPWCQCNSCQVTTLQRNPLSCHVLGTRVTTCDISSEKVGSTFGSMNNIFSAPLYL